MSRLFYYPGYTNNLGFTKSSNTFIIESSDGRDCGTLNMPFLIVPDRNNDGFTVKVELDSNRSFVDAGGASEITGALFGTSAGVAQSATTFFVYAVPNTSQNDLVFFLSRSENALVTPVAGEIGDKTTPSAASTEGSFWAIANITEADYAEVACTRIGSITMSKDTSDDWTVTLETENGVGRYPTVSSGGGGGGGDIEYYFKASDFDALETNFAPLNQDNGATSRILSRAFDDTTEEFVNFSLKVPSNINTSGTVTFRVWMYAATAVASRFVQLTFGHRAVDNSESWDGAYTSEDSGDIAIDATQDDITEATWTETVSNLGWSADDYVMCRLSRIAPSGTNLSGDLYVVGFSVEIPRA